MSTTTPKDRAGRWNLSFAALVVAQFISLLGSQMSLVAVPWFVLATTGSPGRMVTVLLADTLGMAASGALAGPLVDRLDRKRVMVGLDLSRGGLTLLIPVLALARRLRFWVIVVAAALNGLFTTPYTSARTALVPALIGEDEGQLTFANSLLQVTMQTTTVFGPTLAGLLVGPLGNLNVVFLDAASYLLAAVLVAGLVHPRVDLHPAVPEVLRAPGEPWRSGAEPWPPRPDPSRPGDEATHPGAPAAQPRAWGRPWADDLLQGLAFLWHHPLFRYALPVATLVQLSLGVLLQAALPVYVREMLRGGADVVGLLLSGFGAGSTLGMLLYGGAASRWPWRRGVTVLTFLAGAALPLWLLPLLPTRTAALAALGLTGFCSGPAGIAVLTLLQTETPPELRGRVISAFFTLWLLATPVGLAVAAPVLERFGPRPVLWALAALMSATAAGAWGSRALREA